MHQLKTIGRPRKTTEEQDFHILCAAHQNPSIKLSKLQNNIGVDISFPCISQRLKAHGICCQVTRQGPRLTGPIRARR
jgi:hypothetical protein